MLIHKTNTFIVEIPKTGTKTVRRVVDQMTNGSSLHGHFSVKEALERNEGVPFKKIIAVIRNPEDRLVSALNYCMKFLDHPSPKSVKEHASTLIKGAVEGYAKVDGLTKHYVFKPQYTFLDTQDGITVYRFEELNGLARSLGWGKPLPHENKSKTLIEKKDVKKLKGYRDVMAMYEKDMELYETYSIFEM